MISICYILCASRSETYLAMSQVSHCIILLPLLTRTGAISKLGSHFLSFRSFLALSSLLGRLLRPHKTMRVQLWPNKKN